MSEHHSNMITGSRGVILWLLGHNLKRAPRRLVLEAVGIAFPVAMLAATLLFVDDAIQTMTPVALAPVQVEMRAVSKSIDVDIAEVGRRLATAPGVDLAEPFAAASVVVAPGTSGQVSARLFAVDPAYISHHPWLHLASGGLGQGALLSQSLQSAPGFAGASSVTIGLPGDAPDLALKLPVGGIIDLRDAATWFSIPYGEAKGDVAAIPRAIVIDTATFARDVLPVLRKWAKDGGLPPFDPGADELPRASLEAHVTINHGAYPADPGQAAIWSAKLQRALGLLANAPVIVADNAAEALTESQQDATNAKILFLLLGIPGVIVATGLGLTSASALVEANRREEALLRMRGATIGQIAGLSTAHAAAAGLAGSVVGLLVAGTAVSAVIGRPVWEGVPLSALLLSIGLAVAAGATTSAVRVLSLRRSGRQSEVFERRLLDRGWQPLWRRGRLDMVLILIGVGILTVNVLAGGLRSSPIEGPGLALSFYVLLAPLCMWLGLSLLIIRGLLALLAAWARPERNQPLSSWLGAAVRWLGRRPAQTARALAIGALAVAFGTNVLAFTATYQTAKRDDALAAMGSDLRLTPRTSTVTLPALGSDFGQEIASVTPIRIVPARVDSDRKSILAIDLATFEATATIAPRMLVGPGLAALAKEPRGALINSEIAADYALKIGDNVPLTSFPDDFENARELKLPVVGIFSSFPPTFPAAEVVTLVDAMPRANTVPPDFYLARVAPGKTPGTVARRMRNGPFVQNFVVTTTTAAIGRGLTALNLTGLSLIEAVGASLVAAVGVAMLGAFLILERRREYAILHTIGADTRQILTGPMLEGTVVVLGSLAIGVPIGLGLSILAVRVLGLFFVLEPPLITVPFGQLAALVLFMAAASAIGLGAALAAVTQVQAAPVLRAP